MASLPRKFGRMAPVLVALTIGAGSELAHADQDPGSSTGFVVKEWKVPHSCGAQQQFEALVREAVGDWPEPTPKMHVSIEVERTRRRFALLMTTEGTSGSGTRKLRANNCEELLSTAAVVLSLALDSAALYDNERDNAVVIAPAPQSVARPHSSSSSMRQVGDDETPSLRKRRESDSVLAKVVNREKLDVGLHLVALSEVGTLPRPAVGLGVVASAHPGPYQVSFRLTQWAEQVQFVGEAEDRGGSFELLSGSLHLCREFSHGRYPVGLCVLGSLARISATGIADQPNSAVNILGSAGVAAFHDLPIGPTSIRLHAETLGHFNRPRYSVTIHEDPTDVDRQEIQVHQPSEVAVRLGASWGLSF